MQALNALQPLLFVPPAELRDVTYADWRMGEYKLKLSSGDLSGLTEEELARVGALVSFARSGATVSVAMMQLFGYLLHGMIGAVIHDSDPNDACICESMLFSANMHLSAGSADKLRELCDRFSSDVLSLLCDLYVPGAQLTEQDVELLQRTGLLVQQ